MGVNSRAEFDLMNFDAMGYNVAPAVGSIWDGGKFAGGMGPTEILAPDYWTLRARSNQYFTTNIYAQALINRLVTNEINTGLWPEAMPDESTLGLDAGSLDDWSEDVEQRFHLWAKTPEACDFKKTDTFNKMQDTIRREALIGGDMLVILQMDPKTKRPTVLTVRGENVRNPLDPSLMENAEKAGRRVVQGVELDSVGRHVAFYINQLDGVSKRIPARGSRSGRRVAWLVYGCDRRAGDVRGMPMLGLAMQSLSELDRYRDSALRAAVVNSMLAMFIKKEDDKPGTKPVTGGAVRKGTVAVSDSDGTPRNINVAQGLPGTVYDELQTGETPVAFQSNVDVKLGPFEEVIISGIAMAYQIPPEILRLSFSNNYSASQAAINEFKIYLNKTRTEFGEQLCGPIYNEWLVSEALLDKIGESQKIITAAFDRANFENFAAWSFAEWSGAIKPSTDILKQAKGYKELLSEGWITNARATRETTGQKFSRNMRQLKRENQLKADVLKPILELEKEFGPDSTQDALKAIGDNVIDMQDRIDELGGS
jgi:capsid protein